MASDHFQCPEGGKLLF
uniref:Uncharacterized protein n=1 Tax=Anguilla anguilla TaxID=7936 RepID=A0A0E9V723_ANGAN